MGRDGGEEHMNMVYAIRHVLQDLHKAYPDRGLGGSIGEQSMMLWLGPQDRKGRRIPDGIIGWDTGFVLIECGNTKADKWPGHAWIHWGFDGAVTLLNAEPGRCEILDTIVSRFEHEAQARRVLQ
jgi:hypothetical protein